MSLHKNVPTESKYDLGLCQALCVHSKTNTNCRRMRRPVKCQMDITFRKNVLLPPSGEYKKKASYSSITFARFYQTVWRRGSGKKEDQCQKLVPMYITRYLCTVQGTYVQYRVPMYSTRYCTSYDNNIHCIVGLNIKVPIK